MPEIPGQPDWSEDQLSLGRPAAMDTPTLIEWIQRNLETMRETVERHLEMSKAHEQWHLDNPGYIAGCCVRSGILTMNESRDLLLKLPFQKKTKDEIFQQALDAFRGYNGNVMYVDKGVTVTPVDPNPEIIEFSRRKRDQ